MVHLRQSHYTYYTWDRFSSNVAGDMHVGKCKGYSNVHAANAMPSQDLLDICQTHSSLLLIIRLNVVFFGITVCDDTICHLMHLFPLMLSHSSAFLTDGSMFRFIHLVAVLWSLFPSAKRLCNSQCPSICLFVIGITQKSFKVIFHENL